MICPGPAWQSTLSTLGCLTRHSQAATFPKYWDCNAGHPGWLSLISRSFGHIIPQPTVIWLQFTIKIFLENKLPQHSDPMSSASRPPHQIRVIFILWMDQSYMYLRNGSIKRNIKLQLFHKKKHCNNAIPLGGTLHWGCLIWWNVESKLYLKKEHCYKAVP